jgi:translation initiation factor 2 subunit 2
MDYEQLLDKAYENVGKCEEGSRFEIKKANILHEGKKTIIVNFSQIVSCLRRNQEHFAKFLYKNLASYGDIAGDRLILGRKISPEMITKKIQLYYDEYVKCPTCEKPDTELIEESSEDYLRCLACGKKIKVHKI